VKVGERPAVLDAAPLAREAGRIAYREVRVTRGPAAPSSVRTRRGGGRPAPDGG
jgi:hypothetical protein